MIIVKLQGGLGNQMFQYAFGLSRAAALNSPLLLDLSFFNSGQPGSDIARREFELDLFSDKIAIADHTIVAGFVNPTRLQRILNKLGIAKKNIYRELFLKVDPTVFNVLPPVYFDGFWQSEAYFKSNESLIRAAFEFKKPLNSQSQHIANTLARQPNNVSVHIRRGDYISSARTNELHGTCSVKYYQEAISLIQAKLSNPRFYFFSDEPNWVMNNLVNGLENYQVVDHNQGADSWQDMALMSQCQHHIIANSSFSWWGAWLNPDKEKIVIAPQNWFNTKTEIFNDADIISKNWIKITND